jgi:MoxR-like ATPase
VTALTAETIEAKAEGFRTAYERVKGEIGKVIVGHDEIVHGVLTCLFIGGHALLEGVPGLGKTLLVRTLADAVSLDFNRIQFTPDLMPADIIGTNMVMELPDGRRIFEFQAGPVFSQIVLADEINRATPKTQSALLEAMQEHSVTVGGHIHKLKEPFFVMATQNPIEQEGTYPLPEAQLDRFIFNTLLDYLTADHEMEVLGLTTTTRQARVEAVTSAEEILEFQRVVRMVPIADSVARYAVDLVRGTRPTDASAPDFIKKYVNFGASVRAAQFLVLAAKARALMRHRYHVSYEDVIALMRPILRHRILLNFQAESDRLTQDDILKKLLEAMPAPRD